jgi:betaine-aldehyde dehydrogenase
MFLGQLAEDAGIPAGVFSVIAGDRDAGAALAANPAVMAISFTGSSATGSAIISNTAGRVGATFLELGGKSALVIFDDISLDKAVKTVMNGILTNGGQICTAHSRLIVQDSLKAPLLAALKTALETVPYATNPLADVEAEEGWGGMWAGKLQAVVSESQFVKIQKFLSDARSSGARFVCGGEAPPLDQGYFLQPTVITDVDIDSTVWQQEVFGPVLVVRSFSTEAEAVIEANSTPYGLASTVMAADLARAGRVANQIRAGAVYATDSGEGILNEFPNVPRGGFGVSGLGRELGLGGLHEYTELKSINYTGSFAKL